MKLNSFLFCGLVFSLFAASADAQKDELYRIKKTGKVSKQIGKIAEITPLAITFNGRGGAEKVPVWEVAKISSASEPVEVEKARDRIDAARYDEAIELLARVKTGSDPITDAEVAWYRAVAMSEMAFSGGGYTAIEAGSEVQKFIKKYSKSHHFVPATDLMGRLAMADGKVDFAMSQFGLLSKSKWPEYVARGHFFGGEAQLRAKQYPQAAASFDRVVAIAANDDVTQRYKRLAQCQQAKVAALTGGDTQAAISQLEKIIEQENPDDKELFAYAYNALGSCYLKDNDLAEAEEKFLFTHLLFDTESGPHAEAVFQLANIWNSQKKTDRASEARQILKSRYRNTWWSSQLN